MTTSDSKNKINKRVKDFSNHLMSNSKWYKLFKFLSSVTDNIDVIEIISIWNNTRNERLEKRIVANFESSFSNTGIKDVLLGGPLQFNEIKEIIIKSKHTSVIIKGIHQLGKFDFDEGEDFIKIYGYK